jgi:hypothetical protein
MTRKNFNTAPSTRTGSRKAFIRLTQRRVHREWPAPGNRPATPRTATLAGHKRQIDVSGVLPTASLPTSDGARSRRVGVRSPGSCPLLSVTLSIGIPAVCFRSSAGWTPLRQATGSPVQVLAEAASSGGTGASRWSWRTICGMSAHSRSGGQCMNMQTGSLFSGGDGARVLLIRARLRAMRRWRGLLVSGRPEPGCGRARQMPSLGA